MRAGVKESTQKELAFLTGEFIETIRDPVWKDVLLSAGFKKLYLSKAMQKLGNIKQLGPVYHLYPGAVHTRLNHSLGVFHVARLIMLALLQQNSHQTNATIEFSHEHIMSFLSACMLHDIGHFPYAHALKELALKEHEQLAREIITEDDELKTILINDIGASVLDVCSIIDSSLPVQSPQIEFFRNLLSGTLDPDKLDYLNRDAYFCGVPYGTQDVSYITRNLISIPAGNIAIPLSSIGSVEHVLFSKYLMYKNVYWHKTTRCATAMAKKALQQALSSKVLFQQDLYDLDDVSLFALAATIHDFAPFELLRNIEQSKLLEERYVEPFDDHNPVMVDCLSLQSRQKFENKLFELLNDRYQELKEHEVIIDIPEAISLQSDMPVLLPDGNVLPFFAVDELFTIEVVFSFTTSLRKFRIFTPDYVLSSEVQKAMSSIMETR